VLSALNSWYFVLAFPGLSAGLFVWNRIFLLIGVALSLRRGRSPSSPTDADLTKPLLVALTGGVLWLALFGWIVFRLLRDHAEPGWPWFFIGVAVTPAVIAVLVLRARPWGRRRVRGPSPWADDK
jgi:hypothetical protein